MTTPDPILSTPNFQRAAMAIYRLTAQRQRMRPQVMPRVPGHPGVAVALYTPRGRVLGIVTLRAGVWSVTACLRNGEVWAGPLLDAEDAGREARAARNEAVWDRLIEACRRRDWFLDGLADSVRARAPWGLETDKGAEA